MKKGTIIIAAIAVVCIVLVLVGLNIWSGASRPRPEDANLDYLLSLEKKPPEDYISVLTAIIRGNGDPAVRGAAVTVLTDIALRKDETEKIIPFLKDLAYHEPDESVMGAAYANIDLIRSENPLPPMGSLNLSVVGTVRKGSEIRLISTVASTTDIDKAIIGLDSIPDGVDLLSDQFQYASLRSRVPQDITFRLRLRESGTHEIRTFLFLSTDRTDYEEIVRNIVLTVRDKDGEYSIA